MFIFKFMRHPNFPKFENRAETIVLNFSSRLFLNKFPQTLWKLKLLKLTNQAPFSLAFIVFTSSRNSSSFILHSSSSISYYISDPPKIPSLTWALLNFEKLFRISLKHSPLRALTNCFIKPNFIWSVGGKTIFQFDLFDQNFSV